MDYDVFDKKNQVAISTTSDIAAASWNRIQVAITPAAAKDVRNIWVDFDLDTASLTERRQ